MVRPMLRQHRLDDTGHRVTDWRFLFYLNKIPVNWHFFILFKDVELASTPAEPGRKKKMVVTFRTVGGWAELKTGPYSLTNTLRNPL